jgi:hypothetical protein
VIASFLLVGDQPYAATMVESLKLHGCPIVQMSDLMTPKVDGVDEVVRIPFRIPLMLYRLRHLASYPHDDLLIVDTDVIAKRSIDDVWAQSFDIALTKRGDEAHAFPGMEYNTGVMFSRCRDFWSECYEWLAKQDAESQRWYGDQKAVAAVCGRYDLLELSGDEFNWSPSSREDASDARFWHYKGAVRKKWLNELR